MKEVGGYLLILRSFRREESAQEDAILSLIICAKAPFQNEHLRRGWTSTLESCAESATALVTINESRPRLHHLVQDGPSVTVVRHSTYRVH